MDPSVNPRDPTPPTPDTKADNSNLVPLTVLLADQRSPSVSLKKEFSRSKPGLIISPDLTSQASRPSAPAHIAVSGRLYFVPNCDCKASLHTECRHRGTLISFRTTLWSLSIIINVGILSFCACINSYFQCGAPTLSRNSSSGDSGQVLQALQHRQHLYS